MCVSMYVCMYGEDPYQPEYLDADVSRILPFDSKLQSSFLNYLKAYPVPRHTPNSLH